MQKDIFKITDTLPTENLKRIRIYTGTDENLLAFSKKDKLAYYVYKELTRRDYILYFHEHGISKFYQRKYFKEIWQRKDLVQYNDLFYTLESPNAFKTNDFSEKKLLVIFSCCPPTVEHYSHLFYKRVFFKYFEDIARSLVKNVYIMRIMDINGSHGSHYINTYHYPTMEFDIQGAIKQEIEKLNIHHKNVVLYGASKGGTGALLHSTALDLKSLAVDPILNLGEYNRTDYHFLKDLRVVDVTQQINSQLSKCAEFKKYIICSPRCKFNYKYIMQINHLLVKKIEILDNNVDHHAILSKNCVPEQLMILNYLLSNLDFFA
jgi:hypothetical protein